MGLHIQAFVARFAFLTKGLKDGIPPFLRRKNQSQGKVSVVKAYVMKFIRRGVLKARPKNLKKYTFNSIRRGGAH